MPALNFLLQGVGLTRIQGYALDIWVGEDEGHVTQEVGLGARTGSGQIVLSFRGKEWETLPYWGEGVMSKGGVVVMEERCLGGSSAGGK